MSVAWFGFYGPVHYISIAQWVRMLSIEISIINFNISVKNGNYDNVISDPSNAF